MKKICISPVDSVVNVLLRVADRVVAVSREQIIAEIWDKENSPFISTTPAYLGRKIAEIQNDNIIAQCATLVDNGFNTGNDSYIEYTTIANGQSATFAVRILIIHPDEGFLFLTFERIQRNQYIEIVEDKWKMSLDAAGDGMWDLNLDTNKIFFSDKWQEMFGYTSDEILLVSDWADKVHPDDLLVSQKNIEKYLNGLTAIYSTELRYKCKDGTYKWILSRGVIAGKNKDGKPTRFIGTHQDISAHKALEEEYQSNLNILLKLINNLPDAILLTDEHKRIILINKAYCELYNIDGHPKDLAGADAESNPGEIKTFYKYPEQTIKRINEILKNKKKVFNDELEMSDGRIVSRDYIPLILKDDYKGEIWKFTDITLQKNIDNRFEEQRLFYENILNNLPANLGVLDKDGHILFVNPSSISNEEIRQKAIGKTLWEFDRLLNIPEDIVTQRIEQFNTTINEKRKVEWDEILITKSGKVSYHRRYFSPIYNASGALEFIIAYGVNITDRTIAERTLKASMDAFAHSFTYSGIAKALIEPGGRWIEVNEEVCILTGYTKEELLNLHHKDITYSEDIGIDIPYITKLLNKEITTYTIEKRYISKSRQIIVTYVTVTLLWSAEQTPKYFICDIVDITAQKQLTIELQRQNTQLEAAKTSLANKISHLEELSYMIAHNLRGPAGNIKMMAARLIIDDNDPAVEVEIFTKEEASDIIYQSSISLSDSLDTLMELTQIKLNKDITYDECDIAVTVKNITSQLQAAIFEKRAEIILVIEVCSVSYPKVYLESILYNLTSNALKYSHANVPPHITISTQLINEKVCLTVKDNGLGIDLERYGDKVFKLNKIFHQGFDSKGVGLFLTKSQIESLGGSITVKSKHNKGCEFIVML